MFTGTHDRWHWLEAPPRSRHLFLDQCADLLLGRYLLLAAVDAGPWIPSDDDQAAGWLSHGGLAYSPRLMTREQVHRIPRGEADEWYLFPQRDLVRHIEVFARYPRFTLRPAGTPETRPDWEMETNRQHQERFWTQMGIVAPELYLLGGDVFRLVTASAEHFATAQRALR
jgi:hypothetical protein